MRQLIFSASLPSTYINVQFARCLPFCELYGSILANPIHDTMAGSKPANSVQFSHAADPNNQTHSEIPDSRSQAMSSISLFTPGLGIFSDAALPESSELRRKKSRRVAACIPCARAKRQCDTSKPNCGHCQAYQLPCHYLPSPDPRVRSISTSAGDKRERKRANDRELQRSYRKATREYIENLERQVAELHHQKQQLEETLQHNSKLKAQIAHMTVFSQYWQSPGYMDTVPAYGTPCVLQSPPLLPLALLTGYRSKCGKRAHRLSTSSVRRMCGITATILADTCAWP